jgi:hypothetical protein
VFYTNTLPKCFILRADEELDPEDIELAEHYTIETRRKCKIQLPRLIKMRANYALICGMYCFVYA